MVLPLDFREATARAVRLARRTSLGVGGSPEFLFEPATADEAVAVLRQCHAHGIPVRFLGGGTNLLVRDEDLAGAVVATRRLVAVHVERHCVRAEAGASFPALVARAASLGIEGLSGCAGIPGTVGGAVAMNAGGRFGSIADSVVEVEGVDREGRRFRRAVVPADFGYRQSPFDGLLITSARFPRSEPFDAPGARQRYAEALAAKRRTQPLGWRSAGCIFRNPADGPSAGALIDAAGLKGLRLGGALVSPVHANFIVNEGRATARDVDALIAEVRRTVLARAGVDLQLEVRVWP